MNHGHHSHDLKARRESRTPKRLTTTLPYRIYQELEVRSLKEGRSLSNLAAHLIEIGLFGT